MPSNIAEIYPGLYRLTLPLPIKSLKSVFAYLALDHDSNLLIDTGWCSEESYLVLSTALREIGLETSAIQNIVISHLHPDHFGLSDRLKREAPSSRVMIHEADARNIRNTPEEYSAFLVRINEWMRMNGAPEHFVQEAKGVTSTMLDFVPPPQPDLLLRDGDRIKVGEKWEFETLWTPGHTKGCICLLQKRDSSIFFSGDHVLPTITPNISLTPWYDGDPLSDYLRSLERVKDVQASRILPSHEFIFSGLTRRTAEISSHHSDRLEECLSLLRKSSNLSGFEVASKLHWYAGPWESLSDWEKRAALTETLAHLEYLKNSGKVCKVEKSSGSAARPQICYSLLNVSS